MHAIGAPVNMENEPPWSSWYVLQRYSGNACELNAPAQHNSSGFKEMLLTNPGAGDIRTGGGVVFEQVPTPSHPVPSLDRCETCVWRCVGGPVEKHCLNHEWVCNLVSVTVAAPVAGKCAAGAAPSGPGALAAGAACGYATQTAVKEVCGWVLKERFCTEWDPCREHKKVCTDNC